MVVAMNLPLTALEAAPGGRTLTDVPEAALGGQAPSDAREVPPHVLEVIPRGALSATVTASVASGGSVCPSDAPPPVVEVSPNRRLGSYSGVARGP